MLFAEYNIRCYAESALFRQAHWLLGIRGNKPDHSQSLVFHLCELSIWPRQHLLCTVMLLDASLETSCLRAGFLWQARIVNVAFMKSVD